MNENVETKPCCYCAEPIRRAAQFCPFCRRWQPKLAVQKAMEMWFPPLTYFGRHGVYFVAAAIIWPKDVI